MKTLRQRRFGDVPGLGETVQDAADLPGAFLGHQPQGIGSRLAVVDDQRLVDFDRRADIADRSAGAAIQLIANAGNSRYGLANGNDLGVAGQSDEFGDRRFANVGRFGTPTEAKICRCASASARIRGRSSRLAPMQSAQPTSLACISASRCGRSWQSSGKSG